MIKVIEPNGNDCAEGLKAMRAIIDLRLQSAGISEAVTFDSADTVEYLCRMSGGHVRGLLGLLRSACERLDDLPITRLAAEQAVQGVSIDNDRALNRPEYFDILREIDRTHELPGRSEEQVLLFNQLVLEYLNGKAWYAVHPTVKLLDKFRSVPLPATPANAV